MKLSRHTVHILKRAVPLGLVIVSSVGTIGTAYFASKAGAKSTLEIQEAERIAGAPLTKAEKVKLVWPNYVPTAMCAGATIAANVISYKNNQNVKNALIASYAALDQRFQEARKDMPMKVIEEEIQDAKLTSIGGACFFDGNCGGDFGVDEEIRLFCDAFSGQMFHATIGQVMRAEYHFNRNFVLRGYGALSEFYDFLGITPTKLTKEELETLGWEVESGFEWVDIQHTKVTTDDGLECLVLEFAVDPTPQFVY